MVIFGTVLFSISFCLVIMFDWNSNLNVSVCPPCAMGLDVISINLMQLSKRDTLVETASPRLPSNRSRERDSLWRFLSVLLSLDEHVILPVNKFCLMLCKILNRDLLNMFGFGSYHYERRCFICMIGLFVCVVFIWMEWDF